MTVIDVRVNFEENQTVIGKGKLDWLIDNFTAGIYRDFIEDGFHAAGEDPDAAVTAECVD